MPATAAIISAAVAVGSTAYSAVEGNQINQQNKGELAKANQPLPKPPDIATQQSGAGGAGNQAANNATDAAKKAGGFASTILTGPSGTLTSTTGPQRKTLLGL